MQEWFLQIGNLLVYIVIGIGASVGVARAAPFLFNMNLLKEIEQDNRAASYFLVGLLVMVGLIVGLFNF